MRNVTLILNDGTRFHGQSFGYESPVAGEVVFNTAMSGYPESLTDPSYAGQLMTLTYPLVGNYGVPPFTNDADGLANFMESDRIHASAIIVSDYITGMPLRALPSGSSASTCRASRASTRASLPSCCASTA